jgi:hypothetical protein
MLCFSLPVLHAQETEKTEKEISQAQALCVLGDKVKGYPFYVYGDAESGENNFFPTGYLGDAGDFRVDVYCRELPHQGNTCIKISYGPDRARKLGWAGLYWQYPPNNWGNIPKAYDLTGATKLTFWARGERGREVINRFQVGGIAGKYRDSGVVSVGPVTLSKEWKKYSIDLRNMSNSIIVGNEDKECWPFMQPLSRIIGGFCWATSLMANDDQDIVFYLDEIRYESD